MGRSGAPSRRSVLDAVGRIVASKGLEGIRIRQIASEAGVSPGAVLYHFPDQGELLFAVHEDTVRRYLDGRSEAAESTLDAVTQLLAVARAGTPPWANEHIIRLLYELHGLARRSPRHAELMTQVWRTEHDLYVQILRRGVEQGAFELTAPVERLASGLLGLEDGLVLHQISNNDEMPSTEVLAVFAQTAAQQLRCPALLIPPADSYDERGSE